MYEQQYGWQRLASDPRLMQHQHKFEGDMSMHCSWDLSYAKVAYPCIIVRGYMLSIWQYRMKYRMQCAVYGCEDFCAAQHPCWPTLGHKDAIGVQFGLDNISVEVLRV